MQFRSGERLACRLEVSAQAGTEEASRHLKRSLEPTKPASSTLRNVLAIDSNHAETQHNLKLLRRRLGSK